MKSLKLNQLDSQRLAEREMLNLSGGEKEKDDKVCRCACKYADKGGSSIDANGMANSNTGLTSYTSTGGCQIWINGECCGPWCDSGC